MSKRLTCDRFYGGVANRIENLQSFLAYLWHSSPPRNEATAWLEAELGAINSKTRDRYLSFLQSLDLVEAVGSQLHPGTAGVQFLKEPDPKTLFEILDAKVAGFDLILDALATRGSLSDEQLRLVLNAGPYGHDMEGPGVAIRHREWFQALGFVRRKRNPDGTRWSELTEAGYDLWAAYEDGSVSESIVAEHGRERSEAPLLGIPDDPVPDEYGVAADAIEPEPNDPTDPSNGLASQRAATIEHQRALDRLREQLAAAGFDVYKTRHSDLLAYRDPADRVFLFEVKSITEENVWSQVRKAVGQVLEYEYINVEQRDEFTGAVRPGILLSRPPPAEVQEYLASLARSRGLIIVWWADELAGPSSDALLDALNPE